MINGLLLAALLPVAILLYYIYRTDKKSPEPTSQLVKAFFFGILCVPIALCWVTPLEVLEIVPLEPATILDALSISFLGAALPEEGAKLLMLWLLLRNSRYFDERLDGIVYAVFVSLGFAALENIMYLSSSDSYVVLGIARGLMTIPMHFSCGVLMGYFYSQASFEKNSNTMNKILTYLAPVIVHGVYDSVLFSIQAIGNSMPLPLILLTLLALITFCVIVLLFCLGRVYRLRALDMEGLPVLENEAEAGPQYTPQPLDCSDVQLGNDVDELLEAMSKNVHEVWAEGRISEGWTYGEVRNEILKKHPCIVPYENLSELEKDYDRRTATATLKFIIKNGYNITKTENKEKDS